MTARQRLRRATRESLAIPAFSSPIDCTPWVLGGLWPAELSNPTPETASLAQYLEADLRRIVADANDELKVLKRSGMPDPARQGAEARVIDEARGAATRRVESTMRQLHAAKARANPTPPQYPRRPPVEPPSRPDLEQTQILPVRGNPFAEASAGALPDQPPHVGAEANGRHHAVREPVTKPPTQLPAAPREQRVIAEDDAAVAATDEETQIIPVVTEAQPAAEKPREGAAAQPPHERVDGNGRHHVSAPEPAPAGGEAVVARRPDLEETQIIPAVTDAEPVAEPSTEESAKRQPEEEPADSGRHHVVAPTAEPSQPAVTPQVVPPTSAPPPAGVPATKPSAPTGFDADRLNRLLEFVVRQEPRLSWAIGDRADGATVLVTDLAHGWIPSGITLPDGVQLLEPERRAGKVAALIEDAVHRVTYTPGDSLRRSAGFAATKSSLQPRRLPVIDDLAGTLSGATRRHEGLPRIVQRLADAAAAGVSVVDQEIDVLRVHLDTARYQLLIQQPRVDQALLHKCLLMAATEGIASGDTVSANYHLAWYQKLAAPGS